MGRFDALLNIDTGKQEQGRGESRARRRASPSRAAKEHAPGVGVPVPPPVPRTVPRPVPPGVPLLPKAKRPIRQRQPFDIYEDQYAKLKEIADAERGFVNGRGMSRMVREALDAYFDTGAHHQKNRP